MSTTDRILLNLEPGKSGTCFIGIDGHGGSGKSTLAELLSERLDAEVIRTDDFAGLDGPSGWHRTLIAHVFEPVATGRRTLTYQPRSGWPGHRPEAVSQQAVTDVMILEGVTALRREFRPYIDVALFVDTPCSLCLSRGMARDAGVQVGEAELRERWESWLAEEDRYFARDAPRTHADVVVDGTIDFEGQFSLPRRS